MLAFAHDRCRSHLGNIWEASSNLKSIQSISVHILSSLALFYIVSPIPKQSTSVPDILWHGSNLSVNLPVNLLKSHSKPGPAQLEVPAEVGGGYP